MPPILADVVLQRGEESRRGVQGILSMNDIPLCMTLELPWNNNIADLSCIPPGIYRCVPHDSPKFPGVWEVTGVPHRQAILIHAGNTMADTHGCIIVGLGASPEGLTHSQEALSKLRAILPPEFNLVVKEGP